MPSTTAAPVEPSVARRTGRRLLVAGMPGPAAAWLAEAAAVLLDAAAPPGDPVWKGWAQQLPERRFGEGDQIVRLHEFEPTLVSAADGVLYAPRDLRDAVVACQRALGLPADVRLAQVLLGQAQRWEERATLVVSYEAILANPRDCLRRLAEHLAVRVPDWERCLGTLQKTMAAEVRAAGRHFTPPRTFVTSLPADTLAGVEAHGGRWLRAHGYDCVALSAVWAGVTERAETREALWAEFRQAAGRGVAIDAAECPGAKVSAAWRAQLEELDRFFRRFGAARFQLAAAEVTSALSAATPLVESAVALLLARQRQTGAAVARARRTLRRTGNDFLREWLRDADGAAADAASSGDGPGEGVAQQSGKTARQPLPPVTATPTSEAIERLAAQVRGRTVAFLLHGASVSGVARLSGEIATTEVVWAGLNHFRLLEDRFLRPLGRKFSIVFCCADGEVQRRLSALAEFLDRPESNLLITRPDHFAAHADRLGGKRERVALELLPPVWPYPNSLAIFLRLLVQAGPRRIVLFGCDGYLGDDDEARPSYLGAEEFIRERRPSGVLLDTLLFNAHMPRVLSRWRERLGAACPEILNCSPGTLIRGIPTIDYAQAGAALAGLPVTAGTAVTPPPVVVPEATGPEDAVPDLAACLNAGRSGDLDLAREHALRALRRQPDRLSPLAQRVLQTDPCAIAAAYHFLVLTGASQPGPERIRCEDLAREMRETREALGDEIHRWDGWE